MRKQADVRCALRSGTPMHRTRIAIRSIRPEQVGHCQTSRISCLVSSAGKRLERQNAWTDKEQRIARGAFCPLGILVVYLRSFIRS
jgi:hypothetical protein